MVKKSKSKGAAQPALTKGSGVSGVREELLRRVYGASEDAEQLAGSLGLSLEGLTGALREPGVVDALSGLRLLADLQAQLIVSRYRVAAAAKLVELASSGEGNEVTRKACVDLLKTEVLPGFNDHGASPGPGSPLDEDRVLTALGELGGASRTCDPS